MELPVEPSNLQIEGADLPTEGASIGEVLSVTFSTVSLIRDLTPIVLTCGSQPSSVSTKTRRKIYHI